MYLIRERELHKCSVVKLHSNKYAPYYDRSPIGGLSFRTKEECFNYLKKWVKTQGVPGHV